ncbi:biliverdin-producing heme oxygenase [Flavobacterium sp. NPDC079362]|uniref:biliverdin-producing heme oxygenase n=1 Tax=Flavobacterium sp. NPDC079362 TaxID=3390566 RepID=UPI003CFBD6D4
MTTNPGLNTLIDFLDKLKKQTADAHKNLEKLSVSASILSPNLQIEDYCHYLALMHAVHKSTQEHIFPLLSGVFPDLEERKKTQWIENDLAFLNYKITESNSVFRYHDISIPFAIGILYVVEGSSLGGRFILKNVETIPVLSNQSGTSYFAGYGNKTGSYWKQFLSALTEYQQKYNCEDEIIEGAVYAFDCIHNHFMNTVKNEN